MCNCISIEPQSQECYDQMIVVDIPEHMADYRTSRTAAGLSGQICIDPCIFDEMRELWSKGIVTYGCCCGHNKYAPFVNVSDECVPLLLSMGYIQEHYDPTREDTFRLKSV